MKNLFSQLIKKFSEPKRSSKWETVRKNHLIKENFCRMCGNTNNIEVHHKNPFHIHPELELDPNNLISLCEEYGIECHLKHGHLGNWKNFNPNIEQEAIMTGPKNINTNKNENGAA